MPNQKLKNIVKTNSVLKRCVEVVLVGLLVLLFLQSISDTKLYKFYVSTLFKTHHQDLVYYLNKNDSKIALLTGDYYFGGGVYDLNKAEESYLLALKINPQIKLAHYQLARIYLVEGKFDVATEQIDAELLQDSTNQRPYYVRGLIKLGQSDLKGSEADFKTFTAWAKGEWGGYNDLSFVLAKEGKYTESEAVLNEAFKNVFNAKNIPWLWNSLGVAQLNQFKYKEATISFANALALAKKINTLQWHRAYSGNDPKGYEDSIISFQHSIEENLKVSQFRVPA